MQYKLTNITNKQQRLNNAKNKTATRKAMQTHRKQQRKHTTTKSTTNSNTESIMNMKQTSTL